LWIDILVGENIARNFPIERKNKYSKGKVRQHFIEIKK